MSTLATQIKKQKLIGKPRAKKASGFYLWVTSVVPNQKLQTIDGKPLTEKEATVLASKHDRSRRVVVRPASYKGSVAEQEASSAFRKTFGTEVQKLFETDHPLFVKKVRLNSGGYAPDHSDSYFGANRPGQVLFEIHDNNDSVFARAPDKKLVIAGLRDLGYDAR